MPSEGPSTTTRTLPGRSNVSRRMVVDVAAPNAAMYELLSPKAEIIVDMSSSRSVVPNAAAAHSGTSGGEGRKAIKIRGKEQARAHEDHGRGRGTQQRKQRGLGENADTAATQTEIQRWVRLHAVGVCTHEDRVAPEHSV
jgi:hypothetical protein